MLAAFSFWRSFLTGNHWPEWSLKSKSTWYWLVVVSLVCLPGCSGCESQTSPAKPPVTTQSESSPTSQEESSEKQRDDSGRAAQKGSATEIQTARGEAATDSDTASNANGESKTSSASKKSLKSASGEGAAQEDSGTGSAEREGGRSGGSPASGKTTKPSGQTGTPSSPGEALATAQTLKLRSDKAVAGKEYGQAFELATKAWETLQTFPKDAACREMSSDLQRRLEELGTLANTQRGSDLKPDKPLIVH